MRINKSQAAIVSKELAIFAAITIVVAVIIGGVLLSIARDAGEFAQDTWDTAKTKLEERLNEAWGSYGR